MLIRPRGLTCLRKSIPKEKDKRRVRVRQRERERERKGEMEKADES